MDVERSLISVAIGDGDLKPILEANIRADDFEDDEHRQVFEWLTDHYDRYGDCPGRPALQRAWPEYRLSKTSEGYQYYLDAMAHQVHRSQLVTMLSEAGQAVRADDLPEATRALSEGLQELLLVNSHSSREDLSQSRTERLEYYQELAKQPKGELRGITTGFPTLDRLTAGVQEGQLITLVGLPKAGKSMFLLRMAQAAQDAGHPVLFLSFEMSNEEQRMRYDAMRAGIDWMHLFTGELAGWEERALHELLESEDEEVPFVLHHDPASVTTVSAVGARIAEEQPAIVFIDGVYLMDAEIKAEPGTALALTSVTRGLKRLAMRTVPIIGTTQVLPGKYRRSTGLGQGEGIGYTSSFVQDSDVIVGVENVIDPEGRSLDDRVLLKVLGARNAPRAKINVRREWETSALEESDDSSDWESSGDDDSD